MKMKMKIKILNLLIAALLVFGLLMTARPVSAHHEESRLKGVISAIDIAAGSLTIAPKDGGPGVILEVDASTIIIRLRRHAVLADLKVGDRVDVRYDSSSMLALRIIAEPNLVFLQGFVSAVDITGGTLTVTPRKGGADIVLKVDSSTIIRRNARPALLAEVQRGDLVEAWYNPVSFLAARIMARLYLVGLKGVVSAVDAVGATLTVKPRNGASDIVLNVDSTTQIRVNGKPAALADIQPGDLIEARYNPVTFLAARISARSNLIMVNGSIAAVDIAAQIVTVTPAKGGLDLVLRVDAKTIIRRNGLVATLADLQVGDRVEARYNPVTMLAARISARQNLAEVHGIIFAVDTGASTVTITPNQGGTNIILKVDTTTIIRRNGAPAALADLQVGDRILARYDQATMLAVRIETVVNLAELEGTISDVDTGGSMVTITPKYGGMDVVLTVDATTILTRNGAPATLADLQAGDHVWAIYNQATMLAIKIDAIVILVDLNGTISTVDTGAGTITIAPKHGGAGIVLTVDSHTIILRDAVPATLADLQVGDRVWVSYNKATLLAYTIMAWH